MKERTSSSSKRDLCFVLCPYMGSFSHSKAGFGKLTDEDIVSRQR
jgi:hypothetical protein